MNSLPSTILSKIFFLLALLHTSSTFHWSGNTLYDLESTDFAGLSAEAASWDMTLYNSYPNKITFCWDNYILGGYCILGGSGTSGAGRYYGQYFYKTYSVPVAHNQVNIKIRTYAVDSWDGTGVDDHFEIGIDTNNVYAFRMNGFDPVWANTDLCGTNVYKDFPPFTVYMSYPHSAGSLLLKMITCCDENSCNESLGFRNIEMEFVTVPVPYSTICAISPAPLSGSPCPCANPNMFMYPPNSGICVYCHATCATCTAPANTDCTSCFPGNYLSGGRCYPCNNNCATCSGSPTTCTSCPSGQFMVGTTCYASCPSPLYTTTNPTTGVVYCNSPCPAGQYAYWDGGCGPTCAYPSNAAGNFGIYGSTVSTFLICNDPCPSPQILYWNGTCGNSCPPPLTGTVFHARTFCDYSCGSGQFLYWNGSCLNNCPSPLSPELQGTSLQRQFCWYTCPPSQFLYWNGSCLNDCPSPLTPETQSVTVPRKFCWYTCPPSQFLYWNRSCLNNCPSPLSGELQGTYLQRQFCWYTCPPSQFLYWNGSCLSSCPSPLLGEIQGSYLQRQFCWYTCDPSQYLYWNGSCLNNCPSPLSSELQGTYLQRQFCWYTCPPSQFLYWNGSCLSSCPSPLSGEIQGNYLQRQFCWYTCDPSQYLYWNGSCLNNCPSPLSGELQGTYLKRNFCWYTCQPGEYLYYNKTCLGSCVYPLTGETQGSYMQRNFCWYPCMPWQWIYWDQTCQETCPFPLWPEVQSSAMPRNFCWFPCPSNQFSYWNGTCSSECPEPLKTRYENGMWFCDYPCLATEYLYWNGSCITGCPSPLFGIVQGTTLARNFCYYLCPVNQFLYWDKTCQSTCNFPLVPAPQGDPNRQFCWYLCSTGDFLYWNGTCSSQCDPPLAQRTTNSRKFCDYNCAEDQFLAWNGTCLNSCSFPFKVRTEGNPIKKSFCDYPCAPTQYLYWNGSCLASCNLPLNTRLEGSPLQRRFCDYPCVGNQYLYWNGTCSSKCNLPLVIRIDAGNKFCDFLCPAGQIMYWDGTCSTSCSLPLTLVTQGSPSRQYCQYKCLPGEFLYSNGSCIAKCDSTWVSKIQKGKLFCKYPCTGLNYLYFNGSCINSCDIPLSPRIENSLRYCDYPCNDNQYLYWNGSCMSKCAYPLTQRTTGGHLYCDFSCLNQNDFLYYNGTCSSQCPYPLSQIPEGTLITRNFCKSGCRSSQYLYWNQTCSSKCDFPLIKATYGNDNFCYYPCNTNENLYWNGSCLPTCSFPLNHRIDVGLNYCDYPCASSSILYWNGSCIPSCNYPLSKRIESDRSYCDFPCSDITQYLYYDARCSSECPFPLKAYQEGSTVTRKFCESSCLGSYYLYWNGSCFNTCPFPLTKKIDNYYKYCNPPCANSTMYYYEELKTCSNECHVPGFIDKKLGYLRCSPVETFVSSSSLLDMFLYAPLEDGTWTIVKLVKIMQYVKYLDINMPPRLQRLGISKGRNVMSMSSGIVMNSEMKKSFTKLSLTHNYEKNRLHSSFLGNFWEDLTTLLIFLALACFFFVGERLSSAMEWKMPEIICHTLRVLTKWNALIMFFAINLDDVILFSAVEFKSLNFGQGSSGFSFAMSLIFIFMMIAFSAFMFIYVKKIRNKRIASRSRRTQSRSGIIAVDESCQIISRGFKADNLVNQLFFMIYMFRIGVPMLIAVCLEATPITITILEVVVSLAILTFILKRKPFIKRINHQQIVLFEAIVLIMNFCMFILTILSMVGLHNTKGANILGDIVIIGNDIINVMCLAFLVIKLYNEIKFLRRFIKKNAINKAEATGLYLQLLYIPLQLGNMGFEEMIAYDIPLHEAKVKPVKFVKGLPQKHNVSHEMTDDRVNASFEFMDSMRTDRKLLNKKENSSLNVNKNTSSPGDETNRLETFGDTVRVSSPGLEPINYDLESPRMTNEFYTTSSVNIYDETIQNNERQVFLNVNFSAHILKQSQNFYDDESPPRSIITEKSFDVIEPEPKSVVKQSFQDELAEYSEQNLSKSVQNNINFQTNIFQKINRKEMITPDESDKPRKSILKNPQASGSLIQSDLEDLFKELQSPDTRSMKMASNVEDDVSMLNKSEKKVVSPRVKRGRVTDFGDGYGTRGRSQEDQGEAGKSLVKKYFNVRDGSADYKPKEKKKEAEKIKVNEKVMLNLWQSGKRHFKPNYKE